MGTLVSLRVKGLSVAEAHRAIDAAFDEVATVHRLMSFYEEDSDVGRLNRARAGQPVEVHPFTLDVLKCALAIADSSDGCFDISVATELVKWRLLPRPYGAAGSRRHPKGTWRDIELLPDGRVIFHRPLWVDLGGIAKGYAVDRVAERLRASGATQAVVNAGGDIRVMGRNAERIGLELEFPLDPRPVLELTEGSVASSSGHRHRRTHQGRVCGPHVHGVRRSAAPTDRFVCVVAERCIVADALTKVVMADGAHCADMLREFKAAAHLHDPFGGWSHFGGIEV
jgi:thiamine biosynthesis lipoprotein